MVNYLLPEIKKQYSTDFSRDAVLLATRIKGRYGSIIAQCATAYKVAQNIIIGFVVIESEGKPEVVSPAKAVGLMQLTVETAYDAIALMVRKNEVLPNVRAIIARQCKGLLLPGNKLAKLSSVKAAMFTALKNPEFNLWVGTYLLSSFLKQDPKSLAHIVIKYNAGIGNYARYVTKKGLENADGATLYNTFPLKETKAYLLKFIGIQGSIWAASTSPNGISVMTV